VRRLIAAAGTGALAGSLAVALLFGSLQATAAAPYVYGCTPGGIDSGGTTPAVKVLMYNGSGATANITFKALASDGTILNSSLSITTNFTITATKTKYVDFTQPAGNPETSNAIPITIRIVSDQSIESVLQENGATVLCNYLHP